MAGIILACACLAVLCFASGAGAAVAVLRFGGNRGGSAGEKKADTPAEEAGISMPPELKRQWENLMTYDGTGRGQRGLEGKETDNR